MAAHVVSPDLNRKRTKARAATRRMGEAADTAYGQIRASA
jgi:hypothetical protein